MISATSGCITLNLRLQASKETADGVRFVSKSYMLNNHLDSGDGGFDYSFPNKGVQLSHV